MRPLSSLTVESLLHLTKQLCVRTVPCAVSKAYTHLLFYCVDSLFHNMTHFIYTILGNLNEDCYPQEDTKVSKMGLSYLTFAFVIFGCLFILFGITSLLLYLIKSKRGVVVTRRSSIMRMRDEKYALGMIGSDSVYMYFVAKSKAGWFVALTTIVLQVWMLIPFLRASEVNLQDDQIDVEFTWKCPRDSDTCENKGDLNAIGWSIFGVLMATFLSKDLINGIKLIRHSAKTRHSLNSRIRYFFGGVILCFITLFILYVSCVLCYVEKDLNYVSHLAILLLFDKRLLPFTIRPSLRATLTSS